MRFTIALFCTLSLFGCVKKGAKTDPDSKKSKAQVVQVDSQVKDSLKGSEGDFEDWKAIEVKEPGKLRIMVLMGNVDCQCSVEMLDPDGNELLVYENFKKEPRVDVPVDKAKPGYYLIRLRAKKEYDYSAYLIETVFKAAPKVIKDTEPDPEPEPDPKVVEPAVVEVKPIQAKITKSKPGRAGYLVLTLDKGSKDGIAEGFVGTIEGLEKSEVKVVKVLDATSEAETATDAKSIKGKTAVTVQPPKK
jgi:hypothetical protein